MRYAVIAGLLWLVAAPATAQRITSCTTSGKNLFVQDVMRDLYLWYREVPNVDPTRFSSPEAYLDAVRYRPLDSTFSYIADRAATEALFSASQYAGFGFASL